MLRLRSWHSTGKGWPDGACQLSVDWMPGNDMPTIEQVDVAHRPWEVPFCNFFQDEAALFLRTLCNILIVYTTFVTWKQGLEYLLPPT